MDYKKLSKITDKEKFIDSFAIEELSEEDLRKFVENKLKTFTGSFHIGDKLERLGFEVHYDGKSICNFSLGDFYFYACNDNTPFWRLQDFRKF